MEKTFPSEEAMSQRWLEGTDFIKNLSLETPKTEFVFRQENIPQLWLNPDSKFTDQSTFRTTTEGSRWPSFPTT